MTADRPDRNTAAADAIRAKADADAAQLAPDIEQILANGITTPYRIAAELNRRRIRTQRGNLWGDEQVKRLLIRLGKQQT